MYLHALMAAEEWEAGEKSERQSQWVSHCFFHTEGKKQHGEQKDERARERERERYGGGTFIDLSLSLSGCR